jgi:hypothetical protein
VSAARRDDLGDQQDPVCEQFMIVMLRRVRRRDDEIRLGPIPDRWMCSVVVCRRSQPFRLATSNSSGHRLIFLSLSSRPQRRRREENRGSH